MNWSEIKTFFRFLEYFIKKEEPSEHVKWTYKGNELEIFIFLEVLIAEYYQYLFLLTWRTYLSVFLPCNFYWNVQITDTNHKFLDYQNKSCHWRPSLGPEWGFFFGHSLCSFIGSKQKGIRRASIICKCTLALAINQRFLERLLLGSGVSGD